MFDARVLKVLISTPGDTGPEVTAVTDALHKWNADRAESSGVVLLPRFWKSHAVPVAGGNGQTIIDSQLVDDADIVLAFFDSKLGQETADAVSGTAHEIDRKMKDGSPVHIYFSIEERKLSGRSDDIQRIAVEIRRLEEYQKQLGNVALYGSYRSPEHLAEQVRSAIEQDLGTLAPSIPPPNADEAEDEADRRQFFGNLATDLEMLAITLKGWEVGGELHQTLSDGLDFKHYPAAFNTSLDELARRVRNDPRRPLSDLSGPYSTFEKALADYRHNVGKYLWRDGEKDWLRTSSETEFRNHNQYLDELEELQQTEAKFSEELNFLLSEIHYYRGFMDYR